MTKHQFEKRKNTPIRIWRNNINIIFVVYNIIYIQHLTKYKK